MGKILNGLLGMTQVLILVVLAILALILMITAIKDNSLYRFFGGLGVSWVFWTQLMTLAAWTKENPNW